MPLQTVHSFQPRTTITEGVLWEEASTRKPLAHLASKAHTGFMRFPQLILQMHVFPSALSVRILKPEGSPVPFFSLHVSAGTECYVQPGPWAGLCWLLCACCGHLISLHHGDCYRMDLCLLQRTNILRVGSPPASCTPRRLALMP